MQRLEMARIADLGHVRQMVGTGQGRGEGGFQGPQRVALQLAEGDAFGAPFLDGEGSSPGSSSSSPPQT